MAKTTKKSKVHQMSRVNCEKIVFHMLLAGIARVEPSTREFCYRGIRYQYGSWEHIVNYYGIDHIKDALTLSGYKINGVL